MENINSNLLQHLNNNLVKKLNENPLAPTPFIQEDKQEETQGILTMIVISKINGILQNHRNSSLTPAFSFKKSNQQSQ